MFTGRGVAMFTGRGVAMFTGRGGQRVNDRVKKALADHKRSKKDRRKIRKVGDGWPRPLLSSYYSHFFAESKELSGFEIGLMLASH